MRINRAVALVSVTLFAVGGCSSSSSHSNAGTSTVSTTTSTQSSTTTTAVAPTTTVTPTTTHPTPTTIATSTDDVARAFFAGWTAHSVSVMQNYGTTAAVTQALAGSTGGTTGFVFSECSGAAGSIYCTWVRTAESVVLQTDDVSPTHRVVNFTRQTLDGAAVADEFFNAWQAASFSALPVLGNTASAAAAVAQKSQRERSWSPSPCDGAAGSLYCTWRSGSAKIVLQVVSIQPPVRVISFQYSA